MPNLEKARGTAYGGSKVQLTRWAGQPKTDGGPGTEDPGVRDYEKRSTERITGARHEESSRGVAGQASEKHRQWNDAAWMEWVWDSGTAAPIIY